MLRLYKLILGSLIEIAILTISNTPGLFGTGPALDTSLARTDNIEHLFVTIGEAMALVRRSVVDLVQGVPQVPGRRRRESFGGCLLCAMRKQTGGGIPRAEDTGRRSS